MCFDTENWKKLNWNIKRRKSPLWKPFYAIKSYIYSTAGTVLYYLGNGVLKVDGKADRVGIGRVTLTDFKQGCL